MKILTIANQKGGVGKTTLATHLAFKAGECGYKTLIVDLDSQKNTTQTLDVEDLDSYLTASMLFAVDVPNFEVQATKRDGISIVRADGQLSEIDKNDKLIARNFSKNLRVIAKKFDYVIIDTPPTLGNRLWSALASATHVLMPMPLGMYEINGLSFLISTIQAVKKEGYNPSLKVLGVLPVRVNTKSAAEKKSLLELKSELGDLVFAESIAERAAVKSAVANKKPVWQSPRGNSHNAAAKEWHQATEAILGRLA